MAEPAPEKIGKYKVVRALGKGAMGMVYEGFDPVIERRVAIKTILSEYLAAAEMVDAVARFKREAQAGGRLQHPGIIGVYVSGLILELTHSWTLVFQVAAGIYLFGMVFYLIFASSKRLFD